FRLFEKLAPNHQSQADMLTAICEIKGGLEAMGFKDAIVRSSKYMRLKVIMLLRDQAFIDWNLEWTDRRNSRSAGGAEKLNIAKRGFLNS
ncbi:MAG: hypothetical protein ACRD98_01665, partial [Nitrososphaera sp.]